MPSVRNGSKADTSWFQTVPANDDAISDAALSSSAAAPGSAANDNPSIDDLPACLAVTDEEVRLLQQYLGQETLALFG
jgi:hypothetical protein